MANRLRSRRTKLDVKSGEAECSPLRSNRRNKDAEEPFWKLLLQVGFVVACLFLVLFSLYRSIVPAQVAIKYDDEYSAEEGTFENQYPEFEEQPEEEAELVMVTDPPTMPPKHWTLGELSKQDAYAHAHPAGDSLFWQTAQGLRDQFSDLYGGENAARSILETTTMTFNIQHTACRLQNAQQQKRPFFMSFGGYSVTTGRGNYHSQSYPNVLEQKLSTVFELAGVALKLRNAAIGGVPSFPYGWCMEEFFSNADVISWDFSMNEAGGDPTGLEAFLRQATKRNHPMVIVKDTQMAVQRRELVEHYQQILIDPVIVYSDLGTQYFLNLPEEERPPGFRDWRKFGAPIGAPGQTAHHPGVHEHEFIAWILVMHFLNALELLKGPEALLCDAKPQPLTAPVYNSNATKTPWHSILYGEDRGTEWEMNAVSCRTSFDPIMRGNLTDIVVKGGVGEELDVMLPKSKMYYHAGWVLDLKDQEKKAKRNLDRFGGLGFVDSKRAYCGIFASGALHLFLPYEVRRLESSLRSKASDYFKSIVICEVNEQRGAGACDTIRDVHYTVGGANATQVSAVDAGGTLYLGKKICMHIVVPDDAVLTCAKRDSTGRYSVFENKDCDIFGVTLEVKIHNRHINRREDACSVSHVVWEQVQAEVKSQQ